MAPYAAPARATDLTGLPPTYTFVCTGESFYAETLSYVDALRKAGVQADVDVYEGLYHALGPRIWYESFNRFSRTHAADGNDKHTVVAPVSVLRPRDDELEVGQP